MCTELLTLLLLYAALVILFIEYLSRLRPAEQDYTEWKCGAWTKNHPTPQVLGETPAKKQLFLRYV